MALRKLYPPITPYSSGYLNVSDTHSLYWEQSGNADGVPVMLLHGGPGAGASIQHRQFFDPEHYRIIIFDQRGCGRSTPENCLEDNTPGALTEDIEKLRHHLRIPKMHLFGGSWGSTLALLYARQYPQHCISLLLRSIFLMSQDEIDWFLYGIRTLFPETWEKFSSFIPESERADLLSAYYTRLISKDRGSDAALEWMAYEVGASLLYPHIHTFTSEDQKEHAYTLALTEAHFYKHHVIPDEHSILNSIDAFRHIPATIIQGRYDALAPIKTAYALHKAWPEADYIVVPDGGHSALDPSMRNRLIEMTDTLKNMR